MGKQQLSTADVAAEVACLRQRILGMNLINVFDINQKTYVLKLGTTGEGSEKVFVLIESGNRLHMTQYERTHSNFPSNFNIKLRKHIRNRRLNDVRQLGIDRIVDFTFGHEEQTIHLILEIYAQGNIVLTDHNYKVLTLLRTHSDPAHNYVLMPKQPYPVQHIRMPKPVAEDTVIECFFRTQEQRALKNIVTELLPFGTACAEHVVLSAELDPKERFPIQCRDLQEGDEKEKELFAQSQKLQNLMREIRKLERWFHSLSSAPPKGFIITKGGTCVVSESTKGDQEGEQKENANEVYVEFEPFLLWQHRERHHVVFDTFDAALDEFFSKREGQKMALAEAAAESAAEARLLKTKQDLRVRAEKLHAEAAHENLQGQLIECNLVQVDEVLLAVNSALASGMNWDDVKALIKNEAEQGNPVAGRIHSLQLEQNAATLLLDEIGLQSDDDEPTGRNLKVVVDLSLGAAANARLHYERRKKHAAKEQKTHEANEMAIKAAEKKVQTQLKKTKPVASMLQVRKMHWFEKFYWFITTENYLVVSGKDAQQNELLVKRYMKKDDVYVHADLHGASATIVKNYKPETAIPPISLHQAGTASVCRSKAWEGKVITSAWWVFSEQVSKTAPTGEYLSTGSFMIRGKKNYLPPASLTYGFGFMFKLDESSIENHQGERAPKIEEAIRKEERYGGDDSTVAIDRDRSQMERTVPEKSALDLFLDESVDRLSKTVELGQSLATERPDRRTEQDTDASFPELDPGNAEASRHRSGKETKRSKRDDHERNPTSQSLPRRAGSKENAEEIAVTKNQRKGKKKGKHGGKDEEDLKLMSELLQSTGEKKTKQERREKRKQKKAEKRAATSTVMFRGSRVTGKEIHETIAKATEVPFVAQQILHEERNSDAPVGAESDVEPELFEEDEDVELSSEAAEIRQLDSLTGNPHPDDVLLFAIPCCGPYDTLTDFKHKVKLLPGTLKKGKAGKQSVDLLTHTKDVSQRDLQLMKNVPDSEVTNVMLGSVKLFMPGMQKIKQNQKIGKKKKAKSNQ